MDLMTLQKLAFERSGGVRQVIEFDFEIARVREASESQWVFCGGGFRIKSQRRVAIACVTLASESHTTAMRLS